MVQHHLEAVIFDLDGTLLDSERVICDSVSRACVRLGKEIRPDEVAPHLGAPLTELFAAFFHAGVMPHQVESDPTYIAFHHAYVDEHDNHEEERPRLLPEVEETLHALAERNIKMAIATTKPTDRAFEQLKTLGTHRLFGHVQGTDHPMAFKPAPDVVLAACAGIAVDPQAVIMVGDTARDVGAGKAAAAATAVVSYSDSARARAAHFGADLTLRSIAELLPLKGLRR